MSTETLIRQSQQGDPSAKAQLLAENAGLIWAVVRRFVGRGVEQEDLYQLGSLGFLKAAAGFDPSFGTQFSTYAVPKIAGEIRRFLRDDGTVKVSRGLKERAALIKKMRRELTAALDREPTVSELAEALCLSPEELAEAETATAAAESIQQPSGEAGFTLEDVLSDGQSEERLIERIALREAIAALPERLRRIVALRYGHGLTQQQTAQIVGVSQVQVSRIEKKALGELRKSLQV